jgi:polysaccharide deacetylase 2 family uncharacterized protein YibQ
LKKRNLFFVDSLTTLQTVGFALAAEMGLPAAKRDVFLDNDLNPKAIERQLDRLLSMAKHSGTAIGIIHPHKESLTVLKAYVSRLKQQSEIVAISELVS